MKITAKRFFALLLAVLTVLSLCACGKSESKTQGSPEAANTEAANTEAAVEETAAQNAAVESDGYEKFSQLKIGMTESEVNAILGEPLRIDKAYYYYNIVVNGNDMELEVWISTVTGQVIYINGDFSEEEYRAEFADSATDLSVASKLESGELATYEDCATAFKTPGYLTSIDDDGETRYLWVDSTDGYMRVTFRADGTVKSYAGYC